MRKAIELFGLNTLSYGILTIDLRSVSQANYEVAVPVNLVVAFLSITILRTVFEARGHAQTLAYTLSGGVGTAAGILISTRILGH